jgi:hypothetical protein
LYDSVNPANFQTYGETDVKRSEEQIVARLLEIRKHVAAKVTRNGLMLTVWTRTDRTEFPQQKFYTFWKSPAHVVAVSVVPVWV